MVRIMSGYRALARNRDFSVLWIGETVNELGTRMSTFVFPLLGYALSGSALVAALVEGAYLLGLVVTLLPAGVLVDRLDRRRLMIGSSATGALLYASLAAAAIAGSLTVAHLGVVGLLAGAAAGVFGPAQTSAIRSVVSTEQLPTALSQNEARQHVAALVGGPLGGALFAVARWLPFAVDAVTYAVSCLTLSLIRTDLSAGDARPASRVRAELGDGLRFVAARPFFRVLLSWSALVNLTVNALFFVVLIRMADAGWHPAEIGLANAAGGIGGVLGALAAPFLIARLRTGLLTVAVSWALALPLVPLVSWTSPAATGAAMFVLLLMLPAGNAGISAYRIAVTPVGLQGRVEATSSFLSLSVLPLAPLAGGLLLDGLGGTAATGVLAVATVAAALIVTLSRSVRSVPRPAEWAPAA